MFVKNFKTSFCSAADQSCTTMSSADGKGITFSFQIDNLKIVHRTFSTDGLEPTDICSQVVGADVFYLRDPEESIIEFWCPSQQQS